MVYPIHAAAREDHTRLIAFRGSREDALERLPSVGPQERLEFGIDRISLVSQRKRVDLLIHAELHASLTDSRPSLMLVELRFNSSFANQIDEFIQCLQRVPGNRLH